MKAINLELATEGLSTRIETKPGSGIHLAIREGEAPRLDDMMLLGAGSAISSFGSFYRGVLYLATERPSNCTLDALSSHLFMNRRRAQTEIRHWNDVLCMFGVSIKSRKGLLALEGNEFGIRIAILFYFYMITPHYQHRFIEAEIAPEMKALGDDVLRVIRKHSGASLSGNSRDALCFYLSIMAKRIENGRFIRRDDAVEAEFPDALVEEMRACLSNALGVDAGLPESRVLCATYFIGTVTGSDSLEMNVDAEAKSFSQNLRDALERRFGQPLSIDLTKSLEFLSFQAFQRARNGTPNAIFDATPMKRCHLDWFIVFEGIVRNVCGDRPTSLLSDDVARLAMLTYPYWRSCSKRVFRAALVASASFEQAKYCTYCIESGMPSISIASVIASKDADLIESELAQVQPPVDFAITLNPGELSVPTCQLSYSIDERDIVRLTEFVFEMEREWRGKPLEVSARSLSQASAREISEAAFWDLRNEGIVRSEFGEFNDQFCSHCAISTGLATTAICLKQTRVTGIRVYSTPNLHVIQPVRTLAVLLVAERDMEGLGEIVSYFNHFIGQTAPREHSYSMPPDLSARLAAAGRSCTEG